LFATVVCVFTRKLDASVGGVRTTRLRRPRPVYAKGFDGRLSQSAEALAKAEAALSSLALPASTASRPAFVTIASRPSEERDGGGFIADLGQAGTEIFLQAGLDRSNHVDPVQ